MKTASICHECDHYRPNRCVCKLSLIQTKFPLTKKFRKKCCKFKQKINVELSIPIPEKKPELQTPDPYLTALKCYYEYNKHNPSYSTVLDFSVWCRQQIDLFTPQGQKPAYINYKPEQAGAVNESVSKVQN